jgi:UMF1 family MFS transporter
MVAAPRLTLWLHQTFHLMVEVWHIFLGVGATAGFCLGATQAVARAMVGLYAGEIRSGEYYGFWAFTGKMAAVLGLLAIGGLQWVLGLAGSIAVCAVFFLLAWFVSLGVPEPRSSGIDTGCHTK